MIKNNCPNLFSFATSELSQDAFICWLAAWADPKWELCFKIEVIDEKERQKSREEAYHKLNKASNELDVEVSRPTRMGNGRYMTGLRWKGDYRNSKADKLDFDATLENLRKAQQILDIAFPQ